MCCPQLDIVLLSCGNSDMGTHGKLCGLTLQKHQGPILGRCSQFKGESPPQNLEDVLYEALSAHGQLATCKSHQEKSWGDSHGRVWPECPRWRRCWTLHGSAESNYMCCYSLHGKDNWGLTSCWLSSWAMLDICYRDGKQTFLQGFEGQMTECLWKGFECCKLPLWCKGDIKFYCSLIAVTLHSDFFVSHFCLILSVFPKSF